MAENRISNFLLEMQGPKYRGDAFHASFDKGFDKQGRLLPSSLVGYVHDLCGGWIWYAVYNHADGKETVKHVPANCSCCKTPLNGPKLAVEIQQQLNFDRFIQQDDATGTITEYGWFPADEGGHEPPIEKNPCAEIPLGQPFPPPINPLDIFLPPGFLPPLTFDQKALDGQLDEMRREFEKSLEHLDDTLNNPIFDFTHEDGDDDEWRKGK